MTNYDAAFRRVRAGHVDGLEVDELVAGFWSGYPLQNLRNLLNGENPEVVAKATWILSELSYKGASLLDECRHLIRHSHRETRFFVMDAILVNAAAEHSDLIASALELMEDDDGGVRWKALDFASRLSRSQIEAVARSQPSHRYQPDLEWLLQNDARPAQDEVVARLQSDNPQERRFGAIAAARMVKDDPEPLNLACESQDREVKEFALDYAR